MLTFEYAVLSNLFKIQLLLKPGLRSYEGYFRKLGDTAVAHKK